MYLFANAVDIKVRDREILISAMKHQQEKFNNLNRWIYNYLLTYCAELNLIEIANKIYISSRIFEKFDNIEQLGTYFPPELHEPLKHILNFADSMLDNLNNEEFDIKLES